MIRIFKIFVPTTILALLVSEAVLLLSCYIAAVMLTQDVDPEVFLFYDNGLWRILVVVAVELLGLYLQDLYSDVKIYSRILVVQQIWLVVGVAFISQALLSYLSTNLIVPRWMMIIGSGFALVLLPSWRIVYSRFMLNTLGHKKILFLGDSSILAELAAELKVRPELGFSVLGYVSDKPNEAPDADPSAGMTQLGSLTELSKIVDEAKPDLIVVGMAERRQRLPVSELLDLRFAGVAVMEIATVYESAFGRVCTRELRPSQLIFSEELGPDPTSVSLQSAYAFLLALIGIIITIPVMLIVALLVRLTSSGPILIRQTRVGLHGKPFTVYKFRSMYENAEANTGAVWAVKDDPRITRVGLYLRRFRLDELPQLFNVLKGDMSLAGPRPERPEFVATLAEQIPFYRQRHGVKPGITGWAQISYKYGDSIEDTVMKLEYDLYYIKHLSTSLDLYIYFHTFKTMLLRRGAQ
ncbi:MAG TPA: sugar transferase [Bryobacteraceae bacterium]|jgi:sugar transferase (PEP-CTERM system associated)